MSIENVYEIMTQLENTSGKLAKQRILEENKGNEEFRDALGFLLNPYIVTGISTKKMKKDIPVKIKAKLISEIEHLTSLTDVMNYLKINNTGRDIDILAINVYIGSFINGNIQEFIRKFVTKDLKLGISEKTVNKVYGKDTIPSFAVMLAESFAKKSDKVTGNFYVTLKLDGNRCIAIKNISGVKFFTRKGQPIEGMVELEEQFMSLPDAVYDGELLLINKDNLTSDKLFRATQKVVRKDGEKKDLEFHIFDILHEVEFKMGLSANGYSYRRETLDMLNTDASPNIHILPVLYKGNDKSVIPTLMTEVEGKGLEGLMINTADGIYRNKRTTDLLKVKTMKTADLLCTEVVEAIDGQFKGLLGRVNVEYKGNSVGVGSGFSLAERKDFIENPEKIIGKIIEVSYFEESSDEKTKKLSLRFPTYKGIRFDKTIEDINYGE